MIKGKKLFLYVWPVFSVGGSFSTGIRRATLVGLFCQSIQQITVQKHGIQASEPYCYSSCLCGWKCLCASILQCSTPVSPFGT
ncbi:hypothetical protein SUGI_1009770 [Cryptomeria japonica]|nr:hypothetical protein SUGI_1009770 [Cryptomeria japonica]